MQEEKKTLNKYLYELFFILIVLLFRKEYHGKTFLENKDKDNVNNVMDYLKIYEIHNFFLIAVKTEEIHLLKLLSF